MNARAFLRAVLCVLLMAALLFTGLPALAAPVQLSLSEAQGLAFGGAVVGDTIYMLFDDHLHAYAPGDEGFKDLGEVTKTTLPATLSARGEEIWRIDNATGKAERWDGVAFTDGLQLEWDGLGDANAPCFMLSPVWSGDALYALITPPPTDAGMNGMRLVRFDAATGARTDLPSKMLWQLAQYKDGKLLAVSADIASVAGGKAATGNQVRILDADGEEEAVPLGTLANIFDGGIAYDAASDTAYAVSAGQVQASVGGGEFAPIAGAFLSTQQPIGASFVGITAEGRYAILSGTDLSVVDIKAADTGTQPLRIKGFGYDVELVQGFQRAHPDIPVKTVESLSTDVAAIMGDFTSKDDQVDIYALFAFQALDALKQKGYLAELSGVPGVAEAVASMYPQAQEVAMKDGGVYALPASLQMMVWRANPELMEQFGFEMPKTMLEYYEQLGRWENEFAEDNTDYTYTPILLGKTQCFSGALQEYVLTYEKPDAPLKVDTPTFRAIMQAIEAMPYEVVELAAIQRGEVTLPDMTGKKVLLENMVADAFNESGERDESGRPLTRVVPAPEFVEGEPVASMAMLSVFVINPNSPNREQAEKFLAYAAENLSARNKLMLCPDFNEPQRAPQYEKTTETLKSEIADLTARKESKDTAEVDRRAVEDELKAKQEELTRREAEDYLISAQAIADYRVVAQHMNVMLHSSLGGVENPQAAQEINALFERYLSGDSSLDEALRELDKRFQRIFAED